MLTKACTRCPGVNVASGRMCQRCKTRVNRNSRAWRASAPATSVRRMADTRHRRYENNRAQANATSRRWAAEHPAAVKASHRREWANRMADPVRAETERQRHRFKEANRRAMKRAITIPFTADQLAQRLAMFPACWICRLAPPTHIDHVKPLAAGGAHILANLRPACASCNLSKGARWPFSPGGM